MPDSGLYIVTLSNEHPISVNAHDPRVADRRLEVNRLHCKVGRAYNLAARERNYWKTFGVEHVLFRPIAFTAAVREAETCVLHALRPWCMRSPSNRRTEWLEGISADHAVRIAIAALREGGMPFTLPGGQDAGSMATCVDQG